MECPWLGDAKNARMIYGYSISPTKRSRSCWLLRGGASKKLFWPCHWRTGNMIITAIHHQIDLASCIQLLMLPIHLMPSTWASSDHCPDWVWQCVLYWGRGVGRLGHWAIYIYIHSDWTLDQPDGLKDKSWACVVQIVGGRKSALHGENVSCIPPWWAPCCLDQTCKRRLMFDVLQCLELIAHLVEKDFGEKN